jgi:hypothetical protein
MTTPSTQGESGKRASWWSITINNPTDLDREALKMENWPSFVKRFDGQDEVGADGTLHIQGALNTAQVRFRAVKDWLTRAHIEAARDKSALLKYVQKSPTAVGGTFRSENREYLTMEKALQKLVMYWEPLDERRCEVLKCDYVKISTEEYWLAVNDLLLEDSTLVQLFTNPQMLRAWIHTKNVWLKYKKDAECASGSVSGTADD